MDAKERYFWDLNGHLVLRNVLSQEEVDAANASLDYVADQSENGTDAEADFLRESAQPRWMDGQFVRTRNNIPFLLMLKAPYCDPFRQMIVHPQIIARLQIMCGKGFRLDHGPQYIGGLRGTPNHTLHGAGEPHRPYVAYHHQNGQTYVGGVTVTYVLADSGPDGGGFACVPGSHKSNYPMPKGVSHMTHEQDAVAKPAVKAGDVIFFMDGAQSHGARAWNADHPRRAILIKYASRTATRQGASLDCIEPEKYWDREIVHGMTDEQRAVMFGPASAPRTDDLYLDIDGSGRIFVDKD